MAESNVVVGSASDFAVGARHFLAGIFSYFVGKGFLLAPFQNLKSISQTGLRTNRENSIMRSTGYEIFLNFTKLAIRLGLNSLLTRFLDLSGWFVTVPSIICSSIFTFTIRTNRHRNFFTGVYHNKDMNKAVSIGSMLAYDVGSELIGETLSDRYADTMIDKYSPSWMNVTSARRLCESFFLGLSMMILNPLEVLMKRNMLCLRSPSNVFDYFKGSLYSFVEAFSVISVKFEVYRKLSGIE